MDTMFGQKIIVDWVSVKNYPMNKQHKTRKKRILTTSSMTIKFVIWYSSSIYLMNNKDNLKSIAQWKDKMKLHKFFAMA